ncbi:hypothetical protein [Actinoalloteichus caeruleus]|uniref:hypothetical protein n=1 Tax=Actinoalloteichus cyanogriseus TaxID=2893586 RepID=UPI003AAABAFB
MLHNRNRLTPAMAARVQRKFAGLLNGITSHFAELAAISQLLHGHTYGNNVDLAEALRARATPVLGRLISNG